MPDHSEGDPSEDALEARLDTVPLHERLAAMEAMREFRRVVGFQHLEALDVARRAFEQSAVSMQLTSIANVARAFEESEAARQLRALSTGQGQALQTMLESINTPLLRTAELIAENLRDISVGPLVAGKVFDRLIDQTASLSEAVSLQFEAIRGVLEDYVERLPVFDPAWVDNLAIWIPENLRGIDDLDPVAEIALGEGIPMAFLPRHEIVVELLALSTREQRLEHLLARSEEILDDCQCAVADIDHGWADACRQAIEALRLGMVGPAQSHAANIVDSIVLASHERREAATGMAASDIGDSAVRLVTELLSLRPLVRAMTRWFPGRGDPVPDHFARHVTAHAVGEAGVFNPSAALIAVMLAASLTAQYAHFATEIVEPES